MAGRSLDYRGVDVGALALDVRLLLRIERVPRSGRGRSRQRDRLLHVGRLGPWLQLARCENGVEGDADKVDYRCYDEHSLPLFSSLSNTALD